MFKPAKNAFRGALCAALVTSVSLSHAAEETLVPADLFTTLPGLEVTVWAASPMLRNPTNIDIDKDGRIWVAEGVNYRGRYGRRAEGDRIAVLEDTDGDGKADKSWTFVQEKFLVAPLGVAVFDNKIVVSQTPDLIVYTDVNRNLKFDEGTDKREVLLTGFNGRNHDHSLHSVYAGPDGRWYFSAGNCGAKFTDKSGKTFRIGGPYNPRSTHKETPMLFNNNEIAGQRSDDGHVWVGGFVARINPDGSDCEILGHNFRNSYEQTVTSFGDIFQNDNDDPPACRVAYVMEGGNAGFASADGKRSWRADKRPGQDVPTAEWRQEDPGTMPSGDVYGGGSPTGVAFYEHGALGRENEGMLLTCEAGRNVVFGFKPRLDGAGFKLERFDFLTSNKEKAFAGSDFLGGHNSVNNELKTLFRPSDVCVGPDGAVYVSDWFDARVGGHADLDATTSGAIYRVAPRGFKPKIAKLDLNKSKGQLEALQSPAVNVRTLGFNALKKQGGRKAVSTASKLLGDKNPYIQARGVWMLANLGSSGLAKVEKELGNEDANIRIAAFRALRQHDFNTLIHARRLAHDPSPAVRREVALAMRDVELKDAREILVDVAKGYDGRDRHYLEAIGTGCKGKEAEMFEAFAKPLGGDSAGPRWTPKYAKIAWRLHPAAAVSAFRARALSTGLSPDDRKEALTALAFIYTQEAADAVVEIATKTSGQLKATAVWWLLNQSGHNWKDFGLQAKLKEQGIYDPATVQIMASPFPAPPGPPKIKVENVAKLTGNPQTGKQIATACVTCHRIEGIGVDYAPDITAFAKTQTTDVVIRSIVDPSADISHGYDGYEIVTKDDQVIHGLLLSDGNPTIIQSMGNLTQMIPKNRIKSKRKMNRSLMLSAEQMGLTEQLIADIVAYLKGL